MRSRTKAPPVVVPGGPYDFPVPLDLPCPPFCETITVEGRPDELKVPGAVYPTPAPPFPGTPPGRSQPGGAQPFRNYRPGSSVGLAALSAALPFAPLIASGQGAAAAGAELLTGEELTRLLLDQTFRGGQGVVQTELEQLLARPPLTDLERLLQQPMSNPGAIVEETVATGADAAEAGVGSRMLGLLGPIGALIGGLIYSKPAGLSAGEEALRVISGLEPPAGGDQGLLSPAGLAAEPINTYPVPLITGPLEQVTVTARPDSAPTVVPLALTAPGGLLDLGVYPLPTTSTAARPQPRPKTLTQPAPQGRPATPDLTGYDYARFTQPLTQAKPSPRTQTQPQSEKCQCKKPTKEKQKKKPRDVCYRGTYREGPTTLHKRRKEKIPCQ